jgi:hypothetical protein
VVRLAVPVARVARAARRRLGKRAAVAQAAWLASAAAVVLASTVWV